jgi:hypothetical protein
MKPVEDVPVDTVNVWLSPPEERLVLLEGVMETPLDALAAMLPGGGNKLLEVYVAMVLERIVDKD